jgi:hypothetical protein
VFTQLLDFVTGLEVRAHVTSVNFGFGSDSSFNSPTHVESKIEYGSSVCSKLTSKICSLINLIEISISSHFRNDFHYCDQTLVSHLSPFLEELLILLIVRLVNCWKFPGQNISFTFRLICPTIPFFGALMQYLDNLVQEFDTFLLKTFLHYNVVLKLHYTKYNINAMTWDHDLEGSISS